VNLNKHFLTSHMKGINVPDAADVYTPEIVASCEAHPYRLYISQTFRVTVTWSAVHSYYFPKHPLPKREKYGISTTKRLRNIDRYYVFNLVTCGLWCRADVSKQAARIKSRSALVHHNLLCHVPRRACRHQNVIRLPKVSFQRYFRRKFRRKKCVEACETGFRVVATWLYLQTEPKSWKYVWDTFVNIRHVCTGWQILMAVFHL
jgi:hypothetical protein